MDINMINKVNDYVIDNIRSIEKCGSMSLQQIEEVSAGNSNIERASGEPITIKENYGAERYLICNPNMLYRYVNRSFINKSTFKVNKAAYTEAAKKYGNNTMRQNCFEGSCR